MSWPLPHVPSLVPILSQPTCSPCTGRSVCLMEHRFCKYFLPPLTHVAFCFSRIGDEQYLSFLYPTSVKNVWRTKPMSDPACKHLFMCLHSHTHRCYVLDQTTRFTLYTCTFPEIQRWAHPAQFFKEKKEVGTCAPLDDFTAYCLAPSSTAHP